MQKHYDNTLCNFAPDSSLSCLDISSIDASARNSFLSTSLPPGSSRLWSMSGSEKPLKSVERIPNVCHTIASCIRYDPVHSRHHDGSGEEIKPSNASDRVPFVHGGSWRPQG